MGAPDLGTGRNKSGAPQGIAYDVDDWNDDTATNTGVASGYDLNFGTSATGAQHQGTYDVDGWDATAATNGGANGHDLSFGADFAGPPQQGAYDVDNWNENRGGAAAAGEYDLNFVVERNGALGTYDLGAHTSSDGTYDLGGWEGNAKAAGAGGEDHAMYTAAPVNADVYHDHVCQTARAMEAYSVAEGSTAGSSTTASAGAYDVDWGGSAGEEAAPPGHCGYSSARGKCRAKSLPGQRYCTSHSCKSCSGPKKSTAAMCASCAAEGAGHSGRNAAAGTTPRRGEAMCAKRLKGGNCTSTATRGKFCPDHACPHAGCTRPKLKKAVFCKTHGTTPKSTLRKRPSQPGPAAGSFAVGDDAAIGIDMGMDGQEEIDL